MKCLSCGKNFDYEKNYGICPKCGTYHKPEMSGKKQEDLWRMDVPTATVEERHAAGKTENAWEQKEIRAGSVKKETAVSKKTVAVFVIVLICVLCLGIGVPMIFAVSKAASKSAEKNQSGQEQPEALEVVTGQMGEDLTLENTYGRSVCVEGVELLANPDSIEGLPAGEGLIAVKVSINNVEALDYDTYEEPVLGDCYFGYGAGYHMAVSSYSFSDGLEKLVQGMEEFENYDSAYPDSEGGYLFFFAPADSTETMLYLQVCDPADGRPLYYYVVPLSLTEEAGAGADQATTRGESEVPVNEL